VTMVFTGRGWPHAFLAPFGGDFPLAPRESGCFLFPLGWSSGVSFFPTFRDVELLFPLARFGGG
jgi:hypothetical protein